MLAEEVARMGMLLRLRERLLAMVPWVSWIGPLLGRLVLAMVFIPSGWGKLHGLDKVTAFFTELHLPAPHFQAVLVSCTELFCGLAVLIGLLSRLAALPLSVTMVVALLTAKRDDIHGLSSLTDITEFLYLVLLLWLAATGPGAASLDWLLGRRLATKTGPSRG
jgi:putative oxidoreductase